MRTFGYKDDRKTVVPAEAATIRRVVKEYLPSPGGRREGKSLMSIAADLTRRAEEAAAAGEPMAGLATVSGRTKWTYAKLSTILSNPRIAGLRRDKRGRYVKGDSEPIIDPDTWMEVQDRLARNKVERRPRREYLLGGDGHRRGGRRGKCRCFRCGTLMGSQPSSNGTPGYACRKAEGGCGRVRIQGPKLEEEVETEVLAKLCRPDVRRRLRDAIARLTDGRRTPDEQIEDIKRQQGQLAQLWASRQIPQEGWIAASQALTKQVEELERAKEAGMLLEMIPESEEVEAMSRWWSQAPMPTKRAVLDMLIDVVWIKPSPRPGLNKFDPARVEIIWRV